MAEPAITVQLREVEAAAPARRLRTLGRIIPWPHQPAPRTDNDGAGSGVLARAEIRTKRFIDHRRVEEERYDAEVVAHDSSLYGVMAALTEAFAGIEEFVSQRPADEPIVMEIRLRA